MVKTVGKAAKAQSKKSIVRPVSCFRIPTARGARAPPKKVAIPPIIQPQFMARNRPVPKLLFNGTNFKAFTTYRTMGNSIAATACSDIQKDRKADKHKKPRSKKFGDLPKCRKTSKANLVLSPERIIPEAKIKAPRIKKIASLPKRA